jgi:hypothetical protein
MKRMLRFYHPLPKFPSVSITGKKCLLGCAHCRGFYLNNMLDVSSPERLVEFCLEHEKNDGVGLLISGGSDTYGHVPIEPFINTIDWIKENTGLILNLHTGVVDDIQAEKIASTGVDIVSIDIVGSRKTLEEVYGLSYSIEEYLNSLYRLKDAGIKNIAPHITIGLHYGRINGEYNSLEYLVDFKPEILVFLGLIPTKGTPMEYVNPPCIKDITGLIKSAKNFLPGTSVALGCMRNRKDKHLMEWEAIKAGVDRIASSSRLTEKKCKNDAYEVKIINGCCAIPEHYEDKFNLVI